MISKSLIPFIFLLFSSFLASGQNLPQLVNPFIGTGGHGHTFPGATAPFGMVQLSPDTRIDGSWDGCSGYHASDSVIYGFSHTHLSGTGVSDYGDFSLMPTYTIQEDYQPEEYASKFEHSSEKASAGYYSVFLQSPQIKAEMTASARVGFHRYTFERSGTIRFVMDFTHRDEVLEASIEPINATTFKLTRRSKSWAQNQHAYAFLQFDHPVILYILRGNHDGKKYSGKDLLVAFERKSEKGKQLKIKLSYSFTSTDGAELNMQEVPNWNFEQTVKNTQDLWQKELSKIDVKTEDKNKRTIFYTALYHTMIQPNIANDLDGKYLGRDFKIHQTKDFDYYTVFSLWDTFRAAHPLYTLIDEKRTRDFILTFLTQYQQGGRLPVWELSSNETDCMIGYNAVPVIALAMSKGISFDYELSLEACLHSSNLNWLGLEAYKRKKFIAIDDEPESVSKTLEYAFDDYCISQIAMQLGKTEIADEYWQRSQTWKNVFNKETGLMRPRYNGGWLTPFDGREVNNNYTEANSWQYSFFVPQDFDGLIQAHGGKKPFEKKLDELFTHSTETTGRTQVDITGLIGQYAHGNEPSHHIAYLYNLIGKPKKTKQYVHKILNEFYTNAPDGLIGNEDCGQMSAWYVLSSLGIYPTNPGIPVWQVTEPFFGEAILHLENGSSVTITKKTPKEVLARLGFDRELPKTLHFSTLVETPYISDPTMSFDTSKEIKILSYQPQDVIYYSLDSISFVRYEHPFFINSSQTLYFYAVREEKKSSINTAIFIKKPNHYAIELFTQYNSQYSAGGPKGLIDGIYGDENWKKGNWQGYQGTPLVAVIDLKEKKKISKIGISSLQDSRSWILFPKEFQVYTSDDNKSFKLLSEVALDVNPLDDTVRLRKDYTPELNVSARYLKIVVHTNGILPKGHQGFGEEAFIFVDEIEVE